MIIFSDWQRTVMSIFVVALVIRVGFILTMQDGFYFPDSVDYSRAAAKLIANGEFGESYMRGPVYPLFLGVIYGLFGQDIIVIRIVQSVIGACIAVLIAIMARRIGGQEVGALAGIVWSIYPLGVFIAGLVYPTTVVTILLGCGVLCLVGQADKDLQPRSIVLAGILFGLAAVTKPVALVTVSPIVLWMTYWRRTGHLLLTILFLFSVALPVVPWTVRNYHVYGQLVLVEPRVVREMSLSGDIAEKNNGTETYLQGPVERLTRFAGEFSKFWELYPQRVKMNRPAYREKMHARDSRMVKKTVFGSTWTSLMSILSVGPMFFFALIGVGAMWVDKERRRDLSLLCILILSFAVGYSLFYAKTRYRIPVEPYILILSAYGMHQVWRRVFRAVHKEVVHSPELTPVKPI